jgi:hypothetical protein
VGRDMICFIAFDFVLRLRVGGVMRVTLIVKIARVNFDDMPGHMTRFGIPGDMITDCEFDHDGSLSRNGHGDWPVPGIIASIQPIAPLDQAETAKARVRYRRDSM